MFKSKMERHVRFCIQNFFNHDPKKTDDLEPKILKANLFQKRERGRGKRERASGEGERERGQNWSGGGWRDVSV